MKIYLDTSVYNRPFDDQSQPRIWLESVSFSMILKLIETQKIELVTSSVISFENSKNPFPERRKWVSICLKLSNCFLIIDDVKKKRAKEIEKKGIKPLDALHLSCAESEETEYFLTCDDKIAKRYMGETMAVLNPVEFIFKITEEENS